MRQPPHYETQVATELFPAAMASRKVSYKAMDYSSGKDSQDVGSRSSYTFREYPGGDLKDSNLYGLESSESASSSNSDMLSQVSEDEQQQAATAEELHKKVAVVTVDQLSEQSLSQQAPSEQKVSESSKAAT